MGDVSGLGGIAAAITILAQSGRQTCKDIDSI